MQTHAPAPTGNVPQAGLVPRAVLFLAHRSLHTKLLLAFLLLALFSIGIVALAITRTLQVNLTNQINLEMHGHAEAQALAVASTLDKQVDLLKTFSLSKLVQDTVQAASDAYTGDAGSIHAQITEIDRQWLVAADTDPLIQARLFSNTAIELREYQSVFPENVEVFVTDKFGALVAATERTSDYDQSDEEWWRVAYHDGQGRVFIGQPQLDASSQTNGIIIAVPIYNHGARDVVGIMRVTYDIKGLTDLLVVGRFAQTSGSDLLLPSGQILRAEGDIKPLGADELAILRQQAGANTSELVYNGSLRLVSQVPVTAQRDQVAAITDLGWVAIADQDSAEAFQPVTAVLWVSLIVSVSALLGAALLALFIARLISQPLKQISAATVSIAKGDLSRRLELSQRDELGLLAANFNGMADSLVARITAEQAARAEAQHLQQAAVKQRQLLEQTIVEREQLNRAIQDLSSPVLPVLDGILVMPLIGAIDSVRAKVLLTTLLEAIEQYRAQIVILDVTGVPVIDTDVARVLLQAADAGKLLGAQTILVGLRPELAQTIVGLGLNLADLMTHADLQSGVAYAIQQRRGVRSRV